MASLIFIDAQGEKEFPLNHGVTRIGRVEDNEIVVPDESISTHHCELHRAGDAIQVRDLGSTNGTFVNGAPVTESPLLDGESLRVGNVEFALRLSLSAAVPVPATRMPSGRAAVGNACRNHPSTPAGWQCSQCGEPYCDGCIVDGRALGVPGVKFCPACRSIARKVEAGGGGAAPRSFGGEMLAAWKYPFRSDGPIIMLTGTVFFTLAGFAQNMMFLLSLLIFVMITGYWMAYAQKVVLASAQGEEEPPTWPDFSDYLQDIIVPFFHAAGLFCVYLLPFLLVLMLAEDPLRLPLAGGLLLLALFMMPMAWLAISMHETIAGLSPHFVIPSILRIPGTYLAIFAELVVLVGVDLGLHWVLDSLRIPFVGALVSSFLSIYFMMVICRLLGIMYYLNRNRLKWF